MSLFSFSGSYGDAITLLIPYGLSPSCFRCHRGTAVSKFLEISWK